MKKTVETREAIIIIIYPDDTKSVYTDKDRVMEVYGNRKAAKEIILGLGKSEPENIYQVALLDEKFQIKSAKISLTKVKE